MPHAVSSSKGGAKKGPQKYQNTFAFKHNAKSKISQKINAMPNDGVCNRCFEQIEWRKKFKKYKPLTQPKKCVDCQQKSITQAYHVLCAGCAQKKDVCAKCLERKDLVESVKTEAEKLADETELRLQLMAMTERQRRSYFRKLERQEDPKLGDAADAGYVTSGESDNEDGDDEEEQSGAEGGDRAAAQRQPASDADSPTVHVAVVDADESGEGEEEEEEEEGEDHVEAEDSRS